MLNKIRFKKLAGLLTESTIREGANTVDMSNLDQTIEYFYDIMSIMSSTCDNTIAALLKARNANQLNDYMVDVQDVFEDGVSELVVLDESFEKWQDWCLGGGNNTERGMLQKNQRI